MRLPLLSLPLLFGFEVGPGPAGTLVPAGFGLFATVRHGGSHDIYRVGALQLTIPRHTEISELLAKKILKEASQ